MKVEIETTGVRHYEVKIDRLGLIGHIFDTRDRPFRLVWNGEVWRKLTHDENTAIQAAVEPKITLLNITRRLTK